MFLSIGTPCHWGPFSEVPDSPEGHEWDLGVVGGPGLTCGVRQVAPGISGGPNRGPDLIGGVHQ